jgi:hypothetical protein
MASVGDAMASVGDAVTVTVSAGVAESELQAANEKAVSGTTAMAVMVLYVCKVSPGFESDAIAEICYCFLQNWIFRLLSLRQVS